MRRMLVVSGASLGLHIWLFFLLAGYRELVFRVGLLFPHHHDVADIGVVGGAGFAVLAGAMGVAGGAFFLCFFIYVGGGGRDGARREEFGGGARGGVCR